MESTPQLDCAGRRRSPATLASFHRGLPPRNKGLRISARSAAGRGDHRGHARGRREPRRRTAARHHRRAVACRPANQRGTRAQRDRSRPGRGSLVVRHGKGDKRREVGMDRWAWAHLEPWLELRRELPVGRLFCVLRGPTRGRPCSPAGIRANCNTPPRWRACAGGSPCTSSDTLTQSRCPARGSRSSSSRDSSGMPT